MATLLLNRQFRAPDVSLFWRGVFSRDLRQPWASLPGHLVESQTATGRRVSHNNSETRGPFLLEHAVTAFLLCGRRLCVTRNPTENKTSSASIGFCNSTTTRPTTSHPLLHSLVLHCDPSGVFGKAQLASGHLSLLLVHIWHLARHHRWEPRSGLRPPWPGQLALEASRADAESQPPFPSILTKATSLSVVSASVGPRHLGNRTGVLGHLSSFLFVAIPATVDTRSSRLQGRPNLCHRHQPKLPPLISTSVHTRHTRKSLGRGG